MFNRNVALIPFGAALTAVLGAAAAPMTRVENLTFASCRVAGRYAARGHRRV